MFGSWFSVNAMSAISTKGRMHYGKSHLSDIERGERRMPLELARHVDRVLGTDGYFERHCEDVRRVRRGPHAAYFEKALEAERQAESIELWSPSIFPGLLQTAPYARALVWSAHPASADEWVEEKVHARLARARPFDEDHSTPEYWAILHELLLTDAILPPQEMADQLDRVAELAGRRRIVPQIVLRKTGAYPLMAASIMVMTFPEAPPLVYTEASYSADTIDDPALVKQYRKAYGSAQGRRTVTGDVPGHDRGSGRGLSKWQAAGST
ncbi:hypothetical protein EDD90_7720 [Streptomyces sp. Ag109_O5-1]|nr:hypothetical protein EDD90_7720 [Streptomyces sp. Ag109_O5-1]